MNRFLALLISLTALAASPAPAADLIDLYGDWQAFKDVDGKGHRLCHAASVPKKSAGKYKRRGATYIMVAHFPGDKTFDVVSVEAGYTYKKDSTITLTVDDKAFKLATDGTTAWARTPKEDRQVVAALKKGKRLVVKGVSSRGTKTTDTYSLKGSTAALKAIDKACKKP